MQYYICGLCILQCFFEYFYKYAFIMCFEIRFYLVVEKIHTDFNLNHVLTMYFSRLCPTFICFLITAVLFVWPHQL